MDSNQTGDIMKIAQRMFRLSLLFLCCIGSLASASTQLGLEHHEAGDYESAYRYFRQAAEQGDHLAQLNLGVMLLRGQHVERDLVESYAWLALAAQNPNFEENGAHTKVLSVLEAPQRERADHRYEDLFSQYGDQALLRKMQPEYTGNKITTRSFRALVTHAPSYPSSAARRGSEGWVDMMFSIEKDGTTSDQFAYFSSHPAFTKEVMKVIRRFQFEPAMIDGEPVTTFGATYRFLFILDSNSEEARGKWVDRHLSRVRKKAETGDPEKQFSYAYFSHAARSYGGEEYLSPENHENPNDWFLKAASQGYSSAGFFLGKNILYGDACRADTNKSYFWLVQSAREEVGESQYLLAMELLSGIRFEKNIEQALYWLREASQRGGAARLRYAWILATHPDASVRNGEAAQRLWDSLDSDYPDRQRYYQTAAAIAAENGDFEQAVAWQKKAIKDAEKLELPVLERENQLTLYREEKSLRVSP